MAKKTSDRTEERADPARPALKRATLTYAERAELDRRIATRVEQLGENPSRPMPPDWNPEVDDYPHPRNRWIFPSVAYSRGGTHARDLGRAIKGDQSGSLRLVTLRLREENPGKGELGAHLDGVSAAFNGVVRYLIRKGIACPQLSAVHLRYDTATGRLDPHVHGIWDIPSEMIERVRSLLQKTFGGGVWIDEEPIRELRKAAFYICSSVVDHAATPDWPLAVFAEVWRLSPHVHYVRPAGRYAEWIKRHRGTAEGDAANEPDPSDDPFMDQQARPLRKITRTPVP